MIKKYFNRWGNLVLALSIFVLAFAILTVSVMRSTSVSYVFTTPSPSVTLGAKDEKANVDYQLPYPGSVLPDSPLWNLKTLRDRIWYMVTPDHLRKAELALLFSDKRLNSALTLFDSKNPGLALSTLSKGEKYLEIATNEEGIARKDGYDTSGFLSKFALASLKHRELIEEEILPLAPDAARPEIIKIEDYSKNSYKYSRDGLNNIGLPLPIDPFLGL